METRKPDRAIAKPDRLNALTGLRCFAAINIVLFHFSNPQWFGWLAPVVNAGYASVSFFILLSGFVLAYNYAGRAREGKLDRVRFWKARFTRLYPIYLLSLLLSWRMIPAEYALGTVIALGYQADPAVLGDATLIERETSARTRKPLSEIVLKAWGKSAF